MEFTRVDVELERIHNMVVSSNANNTASLKDLAASITSRLEDTKILVRKVLANKHVNIHTLLNTIHTNTSKLNQGNTLLSDTLYIKIETLTKHGVSFTTIIRNKFGPRDGI